MIPDWILSLQASATFARRLEMHRTKTLYQFEWDEDIVNELRITANHLETLLSEQEGIYDECMENTKLN
jgi:hypothetical protein